MHQRCQLAAGDAQFALDLLRLTADLELDKRKAIGHFEVEQNRAKYEKAKAEAETLTVQVAACTIAAPFDGRVAEMRAKAFETSETE